MTLKREEGELLLGRDILHFSFYVVGIIMKGQKTLRLREECHKVKRSKKSSQ